MKKIESESREMMWDLQKKEENINSEWAISSFSCIREFHRDTSQYDRTVRVSRYSITGNLKFDNKVCKVKGFYFPVVYHWVRVIRVDFNHNTKSVINVWKKHWELLKSSNTTHWNFFSDIVRARKIVWSVKKTKFDWIFWYEQTKVKWG